ncbi:2-deoxy-5-keto-D-gluconate 6-phosphate aldolase domain-containing protein, partial [Actinoplanes sp. RD1]|uniref:2-deoxy-5-keto-D-gluconate 6-phosphate aldolase domain-containing protein n=1 Tax=Actinoplanes sp. RD1 TaxID=3064538 RepID=UPI0027407EFC
MSWEPTQTDPLFLMAMDHRDSFGRTLFGVRDDEPTAAQAEAMRGAKRLIFEGLRLAAPRLGRGRAGVLVDEQYGQDVIDTVRADAGIVLAVPVEASGQQWFTTQYGARWVERVEAIKPDYAKVLVRDNPGLPVGQREQQFDLLADVTEQLRKIEVPLLYELLVPPTGEQQDLDALAYDRDVRPDLVTQVIAQSQEHGVTPRLWKVEGLETAEAAKQVATQAAEGGAGCIVLGRDAPAERLHHWLEVASATEGFVGFAIGRSIWEDVLRGSAPSAEAIATRYADFVAHWRA